MVMKDLNAKKVNDFIELEIKNLNVSSLCASLIYIEFAMTIWRRNKDLKNHMYKDSDDKSHYFKK